MATYIIPDVPENLSDDLEALKALADSINDVRSTAEADVQKGREAMDECDRELKKIAAKVDGIMGVKGKPTKAEKKEVDQADIKAPKKDGATAETAQPHDPSVVK